MAERDIQQASLLALSKLGCLRLLRQNVGLAYPVSQIQRVTAMPDPFAAMRALTQLHPVRFGVAGQADSNGIIRVRGSSGPLGVSQEVEFKSERGRLTPEQKNYKAMIERFGGVYLLVRDAEEAVRQVKALPYELVYEADSL